MCHSLSGEAWTNFPKQIQNLWFGGPSKYFLNKYTIFGQKVSKNSYKISCVWIKRNFQIFSSKNPRKNDLKNSTIGGPCGNILVNNTNLWQGVLHQKFFRRSLKNLFLICIYIVWLGGPYKCSSSIRDLDFLKIFSIKSVNMEKYGIFEKNCLLSIHDFCSRVP